MKRILCLFLLAITTLLSSHEYSQNHAISYQGGDRFGDRMLVYAQARYLSYITSVPFLYRSFIYSDLITADHEADLFDDQKTNFQQTLVINSFDSLNEFFHRIDNPESPSTLFIVGYFPSDITSFPVRIITRYNTSH